MAEDDDEWRFSVDEVGPDDEEDDTSATTGTGDGAGNGAGDDDWSVTLVGEDDDGPTVGLATDEDDEEDGGNVAGDLVPDRPVEPGTPDPENVVFTTAGALLTALVFASVLGLDRTTVGAVAGVVAGGAGLLYVVFRRF